MNTSMCRCSHVVLAVTLACVVALSACDDGPVAPDDGPEIESGMLSVHTVASGRWLPEDGLQVWVEDDPATVQLVDLNGSTEFSVPVGDHVVELFRGEGRPFPPACSVADGRRRDVTIEPGRTALAQFELLCEVVLRLNVVTTGVNPDPDGYRLLVGPFLDERFLLYVTTPDEALTLDHDSPYWWDERFPETSVYVWDVAPNCTVTVANPLVFETGGGVTTGEIPVECVEAQAATGTIYYLDYLVEGGQVFRMATDGTGRERLTEGVSIDFYALSPDGTEIIFTPRTDGSLKRVGVDGTGLTTIVPEQGSVSHDLHWGSDGRLLFTRIDREDFSSEVFSVNPDGSDLRQLTAGGGREPVLSPDGSTIAYMAPEGLMLMNPDGSNQRLIGEGMGLFIPAWSPDGSRLAGALPGPNGYSEIAIVDPATGDVTFVGRRPGQSLREFAWSPDGSQLVFLARHGGTDDPVDFNSPPDLFTVSAEGLNHARLTSDGVSGGQFDWRE